MESYGQCGDGNVPSVCVGYKDGVLGEIRGEDHHFVGIFGAEGFQGYGKRRRRSARHIDVVGVYRTAEAFVYVIGDGFSRSCVALSGGVTVYYRTRHFVKDIFYRFVYCGGSGDVGVT